MKKSPFIVSFAVLMFALVLFWAYAHTESYCFFYPSIDTRYAPDYSEPAFSQITTGMTAKTVEKLVGKPLNTSFTADGSHHWYYSVDGKAFLGDWAWLGREIVLRGDNVVGVVRTIYYD